MSYKDIEKKRQYKKEWLKKHPEKSREYCRRWREKYPEKRRGYDRKHAGEWQKKNPEKSRKIARRYREKHIDECRKRNIEYYKKHPEKAREYQKKMRSTSKGRINNRMSINILRALKGNKAGRHWETLVGYTVEQLKQHIQKKFRKGMTWEKFMNGEIHIDHIVPKSHFKYTTPEDPQFNQCWALYNLQPMWAIENIIKGNRKYQLPLL